MHDSAFEYSAALHEYLVGNLADAERRSRAILAVEPNHIDALHLLGLLASRSGRAGFAIECLTRAIQLRGNDAELYNNLGTAFSRQGELDKAVAHHLRAIELRPGFAPAHLNLANALRLQGQLAEAIAAYRAAVELQSQLAEGHRLLASALIDDGCFDEAITCCRHALELKPGYAEAFHDMGTVLNHQGQLEQAAGSYQRAIELNPNLAEAHSGLGDVLRKQNRFEEAEQACRHALKLNPKLAEAYNNLGNALQGQGRPAVAAECFQEAIRLKPTLAVAHYNLGLSLRDMDRLSDAVESFRQALRLNPNHADSHNSLANVLTLLGMRDQAAEHYEQALKLQPDFAIAHVNKAGLSLLEGDFHLGWGEYEWRWKTPEAGGERAFNGPKWNGEPLNGKAILIHAEQGFGDTFQFIRYAAVIKRFGANIVFECQHPLRQLLTRCEGIDYVCGVGDELPTFDYHIPLLSIPEVLKTTLETIPSPNPYLFADPTLVDAWRKKLAHLTGLRIGINWRGRGGQGQFRKRDLPLDQILALGSIPGLQLVSLQKEIDTAEQARLSITPNLISQGDDFDTTHGAFMDTAAIMKNLDLVITSDTAIAHLAGALGVPVWVALPFVPEWRWLLDRSDSPWYPTMRLFRQKRAGDWASVIEEIKEAVEKRLKGQ